MQPKSLRRLVGSYLTRAKAAQLKEHYAAAEAWYQRALKKVRAKGKPIDVAMVYYYMGVMFRTWAQSLGQVSGANEREALLYSARVCLEKSLSYLGPPLSTAEVERLIFRVHCEINKLNIDLSAEPSKPKSTPPCSLLPEVEEDYTQAMETGPGRSHSMSIYQMIEGGNVSQAFGYNSPLEKLGRQPDSPEDRQPPTSPETEKARRYARIKLPRNMRVDEPDTILIWLALKSSDRPLEELPLDLSLSQPVYIRLISPNACLRIITPENEMITLQPLAQADSDPDGFTVKATEPGDYELTLHFYQAGQRIGSRSFLLPVSGKWGDKELKVDLKNPGLRSDSVMHINRLDRGLGIFWQIFDDPPQNYSVTLDNGLDYQEYFLNEMNRNRNLQNLGQRLFTDLFPYSVQDFYFERSNRIHSLTMEIDHDVPWLPWGVIKPYQNLDSNVRDENFFCLKYAMGLVWSRHNETLERPDRLTVSGLTSLTAPTKHGSALPRLASVDQEAAMLRHLADQYDLVCDLKTEATTSQFIEFLKRQPQSGSILHFAGHGQVVPRDRGPASTRLIFSDGHLDPLDLDAAWLAGFNRALVFFNACRSGMGTASFFGLDGWVRATMLDSACPAFIAPGWDVDDGPASELAQEFYLKLIDEGLSVGEALRQARKKIYEGNPDDPTPLAYNLHGYPGTAVEILSQAMSAEPY